MRERRTDAGARETLRLVPYPVAARLRGHFHVHALHERTEARIERVPRMRQVDRNLTHDPARMGREDEEAVAHLHGLLDVVSDEQHGLDRQLPLAPEIEKIVAQRLGGENVERRERLVHQQDVGMNDQRPRESNTLAHAAGELARIRGLEPVEADEIDGLQRAAARLRVGMAERLESELHVLEHRQPGKQREALKHHRDALGGALHGLAEVVHLTARRQLEARDGPQQGRLPGARATQQADDLAGAQCQVHVLEYDELVPIRLPEGLADALHVEQRVPDSSHEDWRS